MGEQTWSLTKDELVFSDRFYDSVYLNQYIFYSNKVVLALYKNILNSCLLSYQTSQERKKFHESELQIAIDSQANGPKREPILGCPKRYLTIYILNIIAQTVLVVHELLVYARLSDPAYKVLLVSTGADTVALQHIVARMNASAIFEGRLFPNDSVNGRSNSTCRQSLETYLSDYFGTFLIWVATPKLETGYHFIDDLFLYEFSPNLQAYGQEMTGIAFGLGIFFLICGLMPNLFGKTMSYDVFPLASMYDPYFVTYLTRGKITKYLDSLRASYENLWRIYSIDERNFLVYRNKKSKRFRQFDPRIDLRLGSNNLCQENRYGEQQNHFAIRSRKLYAKKQLGHFEGAKKREEESKLPVGFFENVCPEFDLDSYINYQPTIRTQVWRYRVMIIGPITVSIFTFAFAIILFSTFVRSIADNDDETLKNHELRLFFSGVHEPINLRSTIIDSCLAVGDKNNMNSTTTVDLYIDTLRLQFAQFLRKSLQETDPAMFERQCTTYLDTFNFTAPERVFNNLSMISPSDALWELKVAHRFIGPDVLSNWPNWVLVLVMMLISGAMYALYYLIYYSIITELCFWLYEIHVKLKISQCILQYLNGHYKACFYAEQDDSIVLDSETFCNIRTSILMKHSFSTRMEQLTICRLYARELCKMDSLRFRNYNFSDTEKETTRMGLGQKNFHPVESHRSKTRIFMSSTYLDFRLFADQIEGYRRTIDFIIAYCIIHGMNIVYFSRYVEDPTFKICFVLVGMLIPNVVLFAAGLFHSQCSKALKPIHELIAFAISGDKFTRHLCFLWRRALNDATGPNTRFSFRTYTFDINYASVLQFNFTVASLYLLAMSR